MEDTPDKDELTKNSASKPTRDIDVPDHADTFSKSLAAAQESLDSRKKDTLLSKFMAFLADKLGGILKGKKEKNANLFTGELFEKQAEKVSRSPVVDDTMWSRAQKQLNEKLGQAS